MMPRLARVACPDCGRPTQRLYLHHPPGRTPRTEALRGWVFCKHCSEENRGELKRVVERPPMILI